ncbi:MAG TPA: ribulose-phosphate 3-epimerase [Tepidisphaeraceae bacterium]|nr:ribulose-phosphate 3-epimerase [Tepidisphaeraceae bacterium]
MSNPTPPTILPSILSADFARAGDDIADALSLCWANQVGGDVIHVDVMDGHLVPNISLGQPVIASLRKIFPDVFFDTHLMIDEPVRYAESMVKAGADRLTIHIESPEVKSNPIEACKAISKLGVKVGITLKPGTPIESIEPILDHVDLVLIMSVEPGFGGQKFMPAMLEKCRWIKAKMRADQILEIDGGINHESIGLARQAGVDWFVVGSALFDAKDRAQTAKDLAHSIRP